MRLQIARRELALENALAKLDKYTSWSSMTSFTSAGIKPKPVCCSS
jgi:hypothetical protein